MDVSSLVADSLLSRRFGLLARVVLWERFDVHLVSAQVSGYRHCDRRCFLGSLMDVDCGGGTYSNCLVLLACGLCAPAYMRSNWRCDMFSLREWFFFTVCRIDWKKKTRPARKEPCGIVLRRRSSRRKVAELGARTPNLIDWKEGTENHICLSLPSTFELLKLIYWDGCQCRVLRCNNCFLLFSSSSCLYGHIISIPGHAAISIWHRSVIITLAWTMR
jgi:hypothetical protein